MIKTKKSIITFLLIIPILIFIAACQKENNMKSIALKTSDDVKLAADFYPADSDKGVILLHMLDRDKSSWQSFAKELQNEGYNVIAIDMRGHGQSDLDVKTFAEKDFNNMVLDAEAAYKYLKEKKINSVSTIGGSIGANVALSHAAKNKEIKTIILLSPGLNYRGVSAETSINNYGTRALFIAASEEDAYSFQSSQALFDKQTGKGTVKFKRLIDAGHGTDMFSNEYLKTEIFAWLDDYRS